MKEPEWARSSIPELIEVREGAAGADQLQVLAHEF